MADRPSSPSDGPRLGEPRTAGTARNRVTLRSAFDWFFRDRRSGRIVVAHVPNLAILLWIATVVARWLVDSGSTADVLLAWAGYVTLGWWAIDEVLRGVNPWRRTLGLLGCIAVVVGVLSRLQA